MMPDPTLDVHVSLQVQEWNAIIEVLAGAPWRIAQPLITKLGQQIQAAIATQAMAMPGTPQQQRMRVVGDDAPESA